MLQGQFKESDVAFSRSELNALIGEAWMGLTTRVGTKLSVSLVVRARTDGIKRGEARQTIWGGLMVSLAY